MRTLVIETATQACSVALFDHGELIAHDHRVIGRGHAEQLVPMIARLPDKGRAATILVSLGPGSFTGVRIGLATARALGVAWAAAVKGYPTLALIAAIGQDRRAGEPITICMNGGHGEWFFQNYGRNGQAEAAVRSITPEQTTQIPPHSIIAGDRARECAALLDGGTHALDIMPDAQCAMLLNDVDLTTDLRPIYGRAPDAKPQKQATA